MSDVPHVLTPVGRSCFKLRIPYKRQPPQASLMLSMRGATEAAKRLGHSLEYQCLLQRLAAMVILKDWSSSIFTGHWSDRYTKSRWALKDYPDQLESVAEELARFDAGLLLGADIDEDVELPNGLLRRAEHLRGKIATFSKEAPAGDRIGKNLWRTLEASLPDLIGAHPTGAQYRDLATLINAALRSYNVSDANPVTPASLRALHRRSRETEIVTFTLGTDSMDIELTILEYSGPIFPRREHEQ